MRLLRWFGLALALVSVSVAAQTPIVIRIGVATGGIGSPPRTGGSTTGIVNAQGLLEKAFAADGIRVEWLFFKGAGPAVNEALVDRQLDFAWQGDLPSIVHRAGGVKTRIIVASGVRNGLYLGVPPDSASALAAVSTRDIDAAFGFVDLFGLRDKGVAKIV